MAVIDDGEHGTDRSNHGDEAGPRRAAADDQEQVDGHDDSDCRPADDLDDLLCPLHAAGC